LEKEKERKKVFEKNSEILIIKKNSREIFVFSTSIFDEIFFSFKTKRHIKISILTILHPSNKTQNNIQNYLNNMRYLIQPTRRE